MSGTGHKATVKQPVLALCGHSPLVLIDALRVPASVRSGKAAGYSAPYVSPFVNLAVAEFLLYLRDPNTRHPCHPIQRWHASSNAGAHLDQDGAVFSGAK